MSGAATKDMAFARTGYAYVPSRCRHATGTPCRLHIFFHGCGSAFNSGAATGAGYGFNFTFTNPSGADCENATHFKDKVPFSGLIDGDDPAHLYSNEELVQLFDPRNPDLPYVYESLSWEHCASTDAAEVLEGTGFPPPQWYDMSGPFAESNRLR